MPTHNEHIQTLTHGANSRHTTPVAGAQGTYQDACLVHAHAQLV